MKDIARIDFETRSAVDIKLGLDRYVRCPNFGVMMLAGRLPGDGEVGQWHRGPDLGGDEVGSGWLTRLHDHVRRGGLVGGWNVMFEWMVWNLVCVPAFGWPELKLEQCVDTMAQAAAHNLPQSLDKCGRVLGLPEDQAKSKRGKHLIQRLCKPHPPTKARPGIWVEDRTMFEEFLAYNRQDVVAEESVARKLRPLSEFQQRVWLLTQKINRRGVPVDVVECERIRDLVDVEKGRLNRELASLTAGEVPAASNRNKLLFWVNVKQVVEGYGGAVELDDEPDEDDEFADLKGKTVETALARDDLAPLVRRALEIRAAVVQTSTAKYTKMLKVQQDGRLRNLFVWHGAGTGRWASRGGINVQNFARPTLPKTEIALAIEVLGRGDHASALLLWDDQVMDAAVSCLRSVLKAPTGFDFIDADFSSVENRVGVWLAGQDDKLEMFRAGFDEYKVFASEALYNVPYDQVTADMRQVSKSAVLGCLFAQGARGLVEYAKTYGVTLTLERSQEIVKKYRASYSKVQALWYRCGDAMMDAVKSPGSWFAAGEKLQFCVHKNFLWLKLPSGRMVCWASPRIENKKVPWTREVWAGQDSNGKDVYREEDVYKDCVTVESIETKTRVFCRHVLTGGSAFQSGVQGTAADILAEGTMETEAAGYETVLLAHDENLSLVPEGRGDPDEFGRLLCTPQPWRADLPLAYEAYRSKRFKK